MKQLEVFINFIYHNYKQEVKYWNIGPFLFSLQVLELTDSEISALSWLQVTKDRMLSKSLVKWDLYTNTALPNTYELIKSSSFMLNHCPLLLNLTKNEQ